MAAISAAAVRLCLEQARIRSEMYSLEARRLTVRRSLWDQQLRLGELTAPQHIRMLAEGWPYQVAGPGEHSPEPRPAPGRIDDRTTWASPSGAGRTTRKAERAEMNEVKPSKWRFHLLFALLGAAMLALTGHVAYLQFWHGEHLAGRAERQQRRVIVLPARPGNIFGRTRGGYVLLAGSRQVPSCYADPVLLGEDGLAPAAKAVADAVGGSEQQLHEMMLVPAEALCVLAQGHARRPRRGGREAEDPGGAGDA